MDSFGWMGGKKLLRKIIAMYIPTDINFYIEVFGGAGWVLFYKSRWAKYEVYNDLDNRLVNLFMQLKWHPEETIREYEFMLNSRNLFNKIVKQTGLTEIQRAARFLFLLKNSFGSLCSHFGTSSKSGGAALGKMSTIGTKVRALHKRLDKVVIENLDYNALFDLYDKENNFFYCDPPYYHGATYDNSQNFDHTQLRNRLRDLEGRFLLSYDNVPEIAELYKAFNIIELTRKKGINRMTGESDYHELLIANYELKANQQIDLEF